MKTALGAIERIYKDGISLEDYQTIGALIRQHGADASIEIPSADSEDDAQGYLHRSLVAARRDPRLVFPRRW